MASPAVKLTFAGDSQSLDRTFSKVQKGADDTAKHLDKVEHSSKDMGETIENSAGKFRGGADAIDGFSGALGVLGVNIPGPVGGVLTMGRSLADLADGVGGTVLPMLKALKVSMLATLGPWGLAAAAVAALVAGFVVAYKKSETFRNIVNGVCGSVKTAAVDMGHVLAKVAEGLFLPYKLAFNAIAGAWNHTLGGLHIHIPGVHLPGFLGGAGFDGVDFGIPNIPTFANGGRLPGGLALVGERGPELIAGGAGAQVFTAGQTRNMLGGGTNVYLSAPAGSLEGALWAAIRKYVRVQGGDVQAVFGR